MKELPEKNLIEKTLTLRTMRLPPEVKMTRRTLIRWLALALGLITPNESRQSVLAVLDAVLHYEKKRQKATVPQILEYVEKKSAFKNNLGEKTLRYHLTQLKKIGLIESKNGKHGLATSPYSDNIQDAIAHWINKNTQEAVERISKGISHL